MHARYLTFDGQTQSQVEVKRRRNQGISIFLKTHNILSKRF